jgi:hypothetical protein
MPPPVPVENNDGRDPVRDAVARSTLDDAQLADALADMSKQPQFKQVSSEAAVHFVRYRLRARDGAERRINDNYYRLLAAVLDVEIPDGPWPRPKKTGTPDQTSRGPRGWPLRQQSTGYSRLAAELSASGIIEFSNPWRDLRLSSAARDRLKDVHAGDKWYLVCIIPEAFMAWFPAIEEALVAGVEVRLALIDVQIMAEDGQVGASYVQAQCVWGVDRVGERAVDQLKELQSFVDRVPVRGSQPNIKIFHSVFPHSHLGLVAAPQDRSSARWWGMISPYLLYPTPNNPHNFGILFVDKGPKVYTEII